MVRGQEWVRARSWQHLDWKWESPGIETRCHRPRCPHRCLEWGLQSLRGDRSIVRTAVAQHRSRRLLTALTLPSWACVLPRAWLSRALIQPWRQGARELFSCVQRGAESTGLRALRTRTLAGVTAPSPPPGTLDPTPGPCVCTPWSAAALWPAQGLQVLTLQGGDGAPRSQVRASGTNSKYWGSKSLAPSSQPHGANSWHCLRGDFFPTLLPGAHLCKVGVNSLKEKAGGGGGGTSGCSVCTNSW